MTENINNLIENDSIMFEYYVHNMKRAVNWYKEIFGYEIIFEGGDCHTEFALPLTGARLALSLIEKEDKIQKGGTLFIRTSNIHAVEEYLKKKGAKIKPIENVHDVVLILWVEDSEGNLFAFEQWLIEPPTVR